MASFISFWPFREVANLGGGFGNYKKIELELCEVDWGVHVIRWSEVINFFMELMVDGC